MSMWYELAGVLILKDSVWPDVRLMCVAKPWIEGSPAPFTCQSLGGSPGSVFSQAITLVTGGPHGPLCARTLSAGRTVSITRSSGRRYFLANAHCAALVPRDEVV